MDPNNMTSYNISIKIVALLVATSPGIVSAQQPSANKPMQDHAFDAVTQPLKDVNLKRDKVPAKLSAVRDDPYDLENMRSCSALSFELNELNAVLGADINEIELQSVAEKRERGVSQIAGGILGGLIPFRGVVRELTGANEAERDYLTAIAAGFARRSFLKGVATTKGCIAPPPAFKLKLPYDFAGF